MEKPHRPGRGDPHRAATYQERNGSLFPGKFLPRRVCSSVYIFFFQAEDGIRDLTVTGVQTCALPICQVRREFLAWAGVPPERCHPFDVGVSDLEAMCDAYEEAIKRAGGLDLVMMGLEIGRASCRERV